MSLGCPLFAQHSEINGLGDAVVEQWLEQNKIFVNGLVMAQFQDSMLFLGLENNEENRNYFAKLVEQALFITQGILKINAIKSY